MGTGPRLLVDAPARTPLPFGLYATTQTVDDPDPHARNGVSFQPDTCDESDVTSDPCPVAPADKAPTSDGLPSRCADAITVYSWVDCGPVGMWGSDGEVFKQRATAALLNGEARAIEREFWTGAHGLLPHLAATAPVVDGDCTVQTAATVLTSGVSLAQAIGELEGAIAECCGSLGTIHLPWRALQPAAASSSGTLQVKGPRVLSFGGTPIVVGAGYPGSSPGGVAAPAGKVWVFGTGPVVGRRTPVMITEPHESLDRTINSMVVIAERTYTFAWADCHFAVLADL